MSKQLNRRIFLRGMGGAVLAAPFLSSVSERTAKGDTTASGKALIVMFTHYGCVTNKWFPEKTSGELTAADLTPTSLAALAPYAKKLLMPRGIRTMNEWTANMTRGQGNDSHTQIVGSLFTCQPVTPNSNDPFSFDQATKFNAKPVGPSLDHVMAQQLSPNGTPLLLNTAGQNDSAQSAISYSASETMYKGINAQQAFSSLTGLFTAGEPTSPDTYAAIRGKSVLDLVKDDLETLERMDMSSADKQKLAAWKELLHSTGTVVASAQCTEELGAMIGATSENASKAARGGLGVDVLTTKVSGDLDGADIYSAIAVLAAACNANPVIFMKYPGNYNFKGLGITMESHSLSHRLDNAGMTGSCLPNALEWLLKVDQYYAQKFANLVGMLDRIPMGNGATLLDSSAAIWFNEMSDGNAHNLNNAPIIQAGSAGGYFKTGQIINVDPSSTPANGNSMSQCASGSGQVNGINQGTGTDPKIANAPVNKYFCNIMNAMGVKAGPDGYPAKGGSEEVTHFGYSDKTEEFIGGKGKVAGATIHNPGGFTELKA
ncbi:DUF1552 domain-containing protein [Sorangium sp. So ce291]|uniref:DUF1552 domain-containing protein n=1 Tax=Sorangium sp. So ce291 TaxID=3133294 RepID=UPI003F647081